MASLVIGIEQATDFLVDLLNIHSPTGYTADAIDFIEEQFNALDLPPGSSTERTRKGALLVHIPGESSERPVGLTAHADTLGLMVTEIKSNGRLKFTGLGGVMWSGVEFEGVTVRTSAGDLIRGTVVPVNGSVHVNKGLRDMKRNPDTLEVRLDVRTSSADETREHGIDVGDFIFLDPRVELTDTGFIRSRFLDDKLSVACIYAAVAALNGDAPAQDTTILISNYEEVGHGGSADWPEF